MNIRPVNQVADEFNRNLFVEQIMALARKDDVASLRALEADGIISLGVRDDNGESALCKLAQNRDDDAAVTTLLGAGANIDDAGVGYAKSGRMDKVQVALSLGANVSFVIFELILSGREAEISSIEKFRHKGVAENYGQTHQYRYQEKQLIQLAYVCVRDKKAGEMAREKFIDSLTFTRGLEYGQQDDLLCVAIKACASLGHIKAVIDLISSEYDLLKSITRDYDTYNKRQSLLYVRYAMECYYYYGHFGAVEYLLKHFDAHNNTSEIYNIREYGLIEKARGNLQIHSSHGFEKKLHALVFYPHLLTRVLLPTESSAVSSLAKAIRDLIEQDKLPYNVARVAATPQFKEWYRSVLGTSMLDSSTNFCLALNQHLNDKIYPLQFMTKLEMLSLQHYASENYDPNSLAKNNSLLHGWSFLQERNKTTANEPLVPKEDAKPKGPGINRDL